MQFIRPRMSDSYPGRRGLVMREGQTYFNIHPLFLICKRVQHPLYRITSQASFNAHEKTPQYSIVFGVWMFEYLNLDLAVFGRSVTPSNISLNHLVAVAVRLYEKLVLVHRYRFVDHMPSAINALAFTPDSAIAEVRIQVIPSILGSTIENIVWIRPIPDTDYLAKKTPTRSSSIAIPGSLRMGVVRIVEISEVLYEGGEGNVEILAVFKQHAGEEGMVIEGEVGGSRGRKLLSSLAVSRDVQWLATGDLGKQIHIVLIDPLKYDHTLLAPLLYIRIPPYITNFHGHDVL
ncbi:hypothetical protein BC829DRAFT_414250 [Chytridium lagenaria]|nr:hypothetical protein BC829DRAFT_414250 [Chytridium lagenaria]